MDSIKQSKRYRLRFLSEVLNTDLKLVFASNLLGSFGDGLYAYLLPYYMAENLKATPEQIGILYAIVSLVAAVTLLAGGMLADRYDHKKIMIAGWTAWLPAPIIFSSAQNWLQMLPGMILWGFWLGGPTRTAYISTSAHKDRMTLTFTTLSAAWSLGYIISPALGGYLAATVGMQTVFYSSSVLYGLAGFILVFISSQHPKPSAAQSSAESYSFFKLLRTGKLLFTSVLFGFIMFTLMLFRPFVPQLLADLYGYGDFEIGVLGSISFFGSAILGILLGKLGDRWRKMHALAASLVLCCSSLLILMASGSFPILGIAFFLAGSSYTTWSLMDAIVSPLAPKAARARWISIPQTVTQISCFIAPYIGGLLYDISLRYPFLVAITLTPILAMLSSTQIFHRKQ